MAELSQEELLGYVDRAIEALESVCFARLICPHRRINLPLFEHEWQSFKIKLCRNSLPKVRIVT
jgi:hypothetical protein